MITYVENLLGLDEGFLLNSDFGIALCLVLAGILIFAFFKVVFYWFEMLFNR